MSTTNTTGMSDAAKVYNEYGEWWCDFVDYRGHQCHYLALHCIGNMASWLQEKDAEIERLKADLGIASACVAEYVTQRDEARVAAVTVLRDFNAYSGSRHVKHNYTLEWPWLKEEE